MSATFGRPVYVASAAALTPLGPGWRGLAQRLGNALPPGAAIAPLAPSDEPCEPRHRKMMSRAAYLAAAAVKMILREPVVAALDIPPADVGCFMGVGASGGDMNELEAMLRESVTDGAFDLRRFGDTGLRAANPLFAFQLMNNFTLCHAAILASLQGPNAAFHSRGAGTVTALREAAFAVGGGDAALVLAGGADSALHPVTALELARDGITTPTEGAAIVALTDRPIGATPVRLEAIELLAAAPAGGTPTVGAVRVSGADVDATFGQTLAAAPALAWAVAFDILATQPRGRVHVETRGPDGVTARVEFIKEPA